MMQHRWKVLKAIRVVMNISGTAKVNTAGCDAWGLRRFQHLGKLMQALCAFECAKLGL